MNVYTYYRPTPDCPRYVPESQLALIELWKRSWKNRGWNPIVLGDDDAKKHPEFDRFFEKVSQLPVHRWSTWRAAGLLQWVAVAAAGGGMVTDYDVLNYGFFPESVPVSDKMLMFCDEPPGWFTGATFGSLEHYEKMISLLLGWKVTERDAVQHGEYKGTPCCGILSMLSQVYKTLDWFKVVPGCAHYSYPGWEKSPMVHYISSTRLEHGDSVSWLEGLRSVK